MYYSLYQSLVKTTFIYSIYKIGGITIRQKFSHKNKNMLQKKPDKNS